MYNPDNYRLLANCFLYFYRESTVFIFPRLISDIKDPIQNWYSLPALLTELHIAFGEKTLT